MTEVVSSLRRSLPSAAQRVAGRNLNYKYNHLISTLGTREDIIHTFSLQVLIHPFSDHALSQSLVGVIALREIEVHKAAKYSSKRQHVSYLEIDKE